MKPFDSVIEADAWISNNAAGPVEVYVFTPRYILGGTPVTEDLSKWIFN